MDFLEPQDEEITIWMGGKTHLTVSSMEYILSAEELANLNPLLGVVRKTV